MQVPSYWLKGEAERYGKDWEVIEVIYLLFWEKGRRLVLFWTPPNSGSDQGTSWWRFDVSALPSPKPPMAKWPNHRPYHTSKRFGYAHSSPTAFLDHTSRI